MDVRKQIPDNAEWSKRNEIFEALKAKQFPAPAQRQDFGAPKNMDKVLYEAATKQNVDYFIQQVEEFAVNKKQPLSTIFEQVSPLGNSLLHVAACSGYKDVTTLVAHHFPFLITRQNLKGDTALNLAAKAGILDTTSVLVEQSKALSNLLTMPEGETRPLSITNEKGNTPLHVAVMNCDHPVKKRRHVLSEAVRNAHHAIVRCLVFADPEVSYYQNKAGKSPLCLAVEIGNMEVLRVLLSAIAEDRDSFLKLQGKSPVHAAIERKDLDMLKEIIKNKPKFIKSKDERGRNLLHCAASIGYLEGLRFLLEDYKPGAFERDNEGLYPLHLACKNGHRRIIHELLDKWPDPTEILSNNCQNILHVAAKSGRKNVIRNLLKNPQVGKLVNDMDNDGNTPLHLAAMYSHPLVVGSLAWDKRTKLQLMNNEGLTPFEIAEKQSELSDSMSPRKTITGKDKQESMKEDMKKYREPDAYEMMMTLGILYAFHILHILRTRQSLFKNLRMHQNPPDKEYIKDRLNSLIVVAVLIAGVAFAAAIQMPGKGGHIGGGDGGTKKLQAPIQMPFAAPQPSPPNGNQDEKGWIKGLLLKTFVIFDTASLNISLMAAIILCWSQLVDLNLASFVIWAASGLVGFALYMMCFAFLAAILTSVIQESKFSVLVVIIEVLFVLAQSIISLPLLIPFKFKEIFIRAMYAFIFYVYFCLSMCFYRCFRRKKVE